MKKAPNFKFQVFEAKELISSLSREMKLGLTYLYIWHESSPLDSFAMTLEAFSVDQDGQGEFKVRGNLNSEVKSQLFFYLPLKKGHFFCKILSIDEIDLEYWLIKLDLNLYMLESRNHERLITVPHHQVYIYLKLPVVDENPIASNVISLRSVKAPREELKEYQRKHLGDSELMGFRVVDLSRNGFSFLAARSEHETLTKVFEESLNLTMMFNGTSYFLKMAKIAYTHPYVNSKAKSIPMYKLGVEYEPDDKLSAELKKFLDNKSYDPYECHAFENFILGKNEEFQID
jgi:hypothetical protein